MRKVIDKYKEDLLKISTRATTKLIEDISINGQLLKYIAFLSAKDRNILIKPYGDINEIARELKDFNTSIGKDCIIITLPPISEEYRNQLKKIISEKEEEARQKIRKIRNNQSFDGLSEDETFKAKKDLDIKTKESLEEIKQLTLNKEL